MRVLIVLSSLKVGGAERNVIQLLRYIQAEGVDLRLCTLTARQDSYLADTLKTLSVPRYNVDAKRLLDLAGFRRFLDVVRSQRIELIHAEDQYATIFAALAARMSPAKFVFTRHNVREEQSDMRERARARLLLLSTNSASRCIAVSHSVANAFASESRMPPERIVTIRNGIDSAVFETEKSRLELARSWVGRQIIK